MENVSQLETHLKTVLWSAYVEGEKPISTLIVANAEDGKTQTLKQFRENKGVHWLGTATKYGICSTALNDIVSGKIKHLVMPDLCVLAGMSTRGQLDFISFLNQLIEEGTAPIQTYYIKSTVEATCGLISAITLENFKTHKQSWRGMGFLSRLMLFSYSYSISAVQNVLEKIVRQEPRSTTMTFDFPEKKQKVILSEELAHHVLPVSTAVGQKLGCHGFRFQVNAQQWLKAHALAHGRLEVIETDFQEFLKIADWINLDCHPLQ